MLGRLFPDGWSALLEKMRTFRKVSVKRHDPVTLFQRHRAPIFKKIIFTELADSGQALCFYVAPYPKLGTFLQKLGEGKGWKFAIAIVTRAVHFLTLQDSRPHVLFGTVLVKHLLDLISSFPQSVQFLRFDFGDAHRGRAIRIESGRDQPVCKFPHVLKLFFKRHPSFCIHWRFSLSPIVKRRPTATSLGCPFFIAVRRFSAGARFVCRDTARLDRRPCCPAP